MMMNLCQSSIVVLVVVVVTFEQSAGVKINKLQVPEVIRHGAPVVLDCDFTLEANDQDLVVKWFFNKNQTLVYQWIPGLKKRPQGLGILKDRLNLEYAASVDANSIHRALHILKAGPDLSGDYTCSVSTLQSEDIRTKSMLVFVPEKNLLLRRLSADEGLMRVQCLADGVFPRPVMSLHSQEREIAEAEVTARQRGQLYEVSATAILPALKDPEEFSCELRIPQANYSVRRETVFYPGLTFNLVIAVSAVAIGAGFQHGYHTGVLNNPVDIIEGFLRKSLLARHLNASDFRVKLFYVLSVVFYMFGGMLGGSMIGIISTRWGRKRGLYYITFLMLIAGPLMTVPSFTPFFEFLMVGRFLVGVMCGANCGLATMYMSEVSPLNLRGSMSTLYQVNISLSILVSQTIGIRQLLGNERNWIYLSLLPVGLVLVSGFMLTYCPESPKYLLSRGGEGNVVEAKRALIWLRNRPEIDVRTELLVMMQQEDLQRREAQIRVIDLFTSDVLRQPMMISLMLMAGQQFSGVNIWVFFSHKVMEQQMGNREDMASIMTCVLSLVSLVMTVASFVIVDLAGRKTLLITSFVGLALSCLSLTLLQSMTELLSPIVQNFFLNGSAIAFNAFYAIGAGPIPWFLVSELFDQSARSSATTVAVLFNWFCSAAVGFIFPIMSEHLSHFVYMVFFIVNIVSAVYVYNQVPETTNKTVEEIVTKFNDDPRNYILRAAPYRESTAANRQRESVAPSRQRDSSAT